MQILEEGGQDAAWAHRTRLTIAVGPLIGPVLARVVGMHASRSDLPLDRLNDAVLVADAIAARAPAFAVDDRLPVSVRSEPGRVELRVGPIRAGGAQRVLEGAALPEVGSVIERLTDEVRVRAAAGGDEYLLLRIGTPRSDAVPE